MRCGNYHQYYLSFFGWSLFWQLRALLHRACTTYTYNILSFAGREQEGETHCINEKLATDQGQGCGKVLNQDELIRTYGRHTFDCIVPTTTRILHRPFASVHTPSNATAMHCTDIKCHIHALHRYQTPHPCTAQISQATPMHCTDIKRHTHAQHRYHTLCGEGLQILFS